MKARITIKNKVPEILEALCENTDCPGWLKNDIWDSFNNVTSGDVSYKASFWRHILRSAPLEDRRDLPASERAQLHAID